MSDQITLSRKDLAKFMALCGQTIVSAITGSNLGRKALMEAYETHMQPGVIEHVIQGSGEDFDEYQSLEKEATSQDLANFVKEIKELEELQNSKDE